MHLLFIVPRFAAPGQFYSYPIGLASVYATVKRHGISVSCLNLCHETSTDTRALLEREFAKKRPDMICTGGMNAHWKLIDDILTHARSLDPKIIRVAGGPIVISDPELALTHLPIDYGFVGEGELALIEFVETLQRGQNPESVKGLAFRKADGQVVLTAERGEIPNLDALPIPEYEDFGFPQSMRNNKYAQQCTLLESFDDVRFVEIVGSRSCPFACTFCYHPLGRKYRQRSLDHIFQEIDFLTKTYGVNVVMFSDELFSINERRALEFAERIKPYGIRWFVQYRVTDVRLEVLEKMVDAGLTVIFLGIESMSDTVLKSMQKKITREQVIKALEAVRKARLLSASNIILGDPADTVETIKESLDWWKQNPVYNVVPGFILAVPDAPIYREAIEKGLITDKLAHNRNLPLVNLSKPTDANTMRWCCR